MHAALIGWWLLGGLVTDAVAANGCDGRALVGLVAEAEVAFREMAADRFEAAAQGLDQALGCQTDALTPIQIASFHRARALAAFFDADEPASVLSFQAALATMPGYALPLEIAPEGHPLRQHYEQAKLFAAGETFKLPSPADGWVTVDGTRTQNAPASRPFVFQRFSPGGDVRETRYVTVGTPVPSYPVSKAPVVPRPQPPPPPPKKVGPALLGTGIAVGLVGGGLYGGAFYFRGRYNAAVAIGDEPAIRRNHGITNGMAAGGAGAGAVGATLAVIGTSLVVGGSF